MQFYQDHEIIGVIQENPLESMLNNEENEKDNFKSIKD